MNEEFNVNNSSDEDWTVSKPDENLPPNQTIIQPIEDWGMTGKLVPPHKNDGWKMPEPKFQKSSGAAPETRGDGVLNPEFLTSHSKIKEKLPENFPAEPDFDFDSPKVSPPIPPQAAVSMPPIEPQPDISEAFAVAEIETPPAPQKKERSKGMRIFLAVFGIFAMFAFAVVFLAVVYFLFFYKNAVE